MHSLIPPISATVWEFLIVLAALAIADEVNFRWPAIKAALRKPRHDD